MVLGQDEGHDWSCVVGLRVAVHAHGHTYPDAAANGRAVVWLNVKKTDAERRPTHVIRRADTLIKEILTKQGSAPTFQGRK